MKKLKQVRQGDVLIERIDGARKVKTRRQSGRAVLAHGEATGHAHTIEDDKAAILGDVEEAWLEAGDLGDAAGMSRKLLELSRDSGVVHQEHARIALEKGRYRVTRQREYSPEAIRNVAD